MDDNLYLDVIFKQNDIKLNYLNHDWLIQRIGIWSNETFKFETGTLRSESQNHRFKFSTCRLISGVKRLKKKAPVSFSGGLVSRYKLL